MWRWPDGPRPRSGGRRRPPLARPAATGRLPSTPGIRGGRVMRRVATVTLAGIVAVAVAPSAAAAAPRVTTVSSIAQLQSAANAAQPGDRIELVDGAYTTSSAITLRKSGTSAARITIAAQHVGGAEIRGSNGFSFADADYVTVEGFRLRHSGGFSVPAGSHHVRITRNVVQLTSSSGNWVTVTGDDVEVDHNTFQNKSTEGVFRSEEHTSE